MCYHKSGDLDRTMANVIASDENDERYYSTFTHHRTAFIVIGCLMPALLLLSVVIAYLYKVEPVDLDDRWTVGAYMLYGVVVLVSIFGMLFMIPYLMSSGTRGMV